MTTTTTEPRDIEIAPTGKSLMERAVCLSLTLNTMGVRRNVRERMEVANVDKSQQPDRDVTRTGKLILQSPELEAIKTLTNQVKDYIYRRSMPAEFFRSGVYLLPVDLLPEVDARLQKFSDERDALVRAFLDAYPKLVADARAKLAVLYNPDEYPDVREVAGLFSMTWRYIAFETPGKLKSISRAMYERESAKMARDLQDAAEGVRQALREAMAAVVSEMVEKMTDRAGGKPQIFRDTFMPRVNDFLDTFAARNLTDDDALAALVDKARKLVSGVTCDELRDDSTLREEIRDGFSAIKASIAPMLTARPTRAMNFRE